MSADSLILFFLTGAFLVGIAIVISHLASPKSTNPVKGETYECGIPTTGVSWLQFNIGYYLFAILFLIFDVETVFLFPWAVVMRDLGMVAFVEILVFLFILGFGLLYAWKKKALIWE
jgi:NADH-quinone oxidoreductase subunit A